MSFPLTECVCLDMNDMSNAEMLHQLEQHPRSFAHMRNCSGKVGLGILGLGSLAWDLGLGEPGWGPGGTGWRTLGEPAGAGVVSSSLGNAIKFFLGKPS